MYGGLIIFSFLGWVAVEAIGADDWFMTSFSLTIAFMILMSYIL